VEQAVTGVNASFVIVFSIFIVAFVGLLVYVAVWAIRRDAEGRRRWEARRSEGSKGPAKP
jgi:phage shock protein PspC (stress-responsive transcriptional regulator)